MNLKGAKTHQPKEKIQCFELTRAKEKQYIMWIDGDGGHSFFYDRKKGGWNLKVYWTDLWNFPKKNKNFLTFA